MKVAIIDNYDSFTFNLVQLGLASARRILEMINTETELDENEAYRLAVEKVVASAGNTGPDPMTVGVPGNVPYVITAGAMSDNFTIDDFTFTWYFEPKVNISDSF